MGIFGSILSELGFGHDKDKDGAATGAVGGAATATTPPAGGLDAATLSGHPYTPPTRGAAAEHPPAPPNDDAHPTLLDVPLNPVPTTLGDAAQVATAQTDVAQSAVTADHAVPDGNSTPATQVDVAARLDSLTANHAEKLDWRRSIVDLLKLVGLDSSLAARKALADELGCPASEREDSARMNLWLHRKVFEALVAHGGKLPADLLH